MTCPDISNRHVVTVGIVAVVVAGIGFALTGQPVRAETIPAECTTRLPDHRIARGERNIAEAWFAGRSGAMAISFSAPTTRPRHYACGCAAAW